MRAALLFLALSGCAAKAPVCRRACARRVAISAAPAESGVVVIRQEGPAPVTAAVEWLPPFAETEIDVAEPQSEVREGGW
jgi:hypothetical protein